MKNTDKNTEIKFDRFDGCNWSYGQDFRYQHEEFTRVVPLSAWKFVEGTEVKPVAAGIGGNIEYVEPGRYNVFEREVELIP